MSTSPYDTLPTGKQALASTGGETIEPNPITDPYGGYREIPLEEASVKASAKAAAQPVPAATEHSAAVEAAAESAREAAADHPAAAVNNLSAADPVAAAGDSEPGAESETTGWEDPEVSRSTPDAGASAGPDSPANSGSQAGSESSDCTVPLESKLHYDIIRLRNRRACREYILPFEETLLVPDTMPDMGQILFTEGRATSSQPGKTRYSSTDTFSGEILLFTVYRPDGTTEAPVDVVRSTVSFQTDSCWGTPEHPKKNDNSTDCSYHATVSLREVEPVKLNERKFQVRGTLCITVTELQNTELHPLRDTSDPALILKKDTMAAADLVLEAEEFTEIEEEITLEEGQPSPARILKESFDVIETHRQVTSGKLLISGLLQTRILYLGEDEDEEMQLCSRTEKTEFTQFVMLQNPLDSKLLKVDFGCDDLKLSIENQNTFRLTGQVRVQIHGYENRMLPVVSDAYHKENAICFDREETPLSCLVDVLSGEISSREVVTSGEDEPHPGQLLGGSILSPRLSARREHGRIIVEGSVPVRILALDEEGRAFAVKSEVPLRGALELPASAKVGHEASLPACSRIKDFWINSINSHQMEINVSALIEVWIEEPVVFTCLKDFKASEETVQQPAMAIYITTAEDTLWDIAKRYQCDSDALLKLNQMDPDAPMTQGTRLLIVR